MRWPPLQRRQRGVAAIELALILLFFMGLLPVVLLFGSSLQAYTVLQKSTHDAARYMATLPMVQMTSITAAAQNSVFVRKMVLDAMAETSPAMDASRVALECVYSEDVYPCGSFSSKPLQVRVRIGVDMPVTFLPNLVRKWLPQATSIPLRANATLRYDN